MSLRTLPEAKTFQRPQNFQWDAPSDVLARWAETPLAAADDGDNTISMFEVIGEDFWTGGGVTAKRISAALRSIGNKDVVVKLNSPGGDMFEDRDLQPVAEPSRQGDGRRARLGRIRRLNHRHGGR